MEKILNILLCGLMAFVSFSSVAQPQIPIAIASFAGQDSAPQQVSTIVQADLERSARFRSVNVDFVFDERQRPDMSAIRQTGAEALIVGSISRSGDGRYDVRVRLWDVVQGLDLGAMSYVVVTGDLRLASHRISDFVYEKITGGKGVFSTRIAYVTSTGTRYNLWVADADGQNAQSALVSPRLISSPSWNPDGKRLAYVSLESGKSEIYIHEVSTGKRRLFANGMYPMWSPDGKYVIFSNSLNGDSQIYLMPADSGEAKLINLGVGNNSEPCFSSDGNFIYFVKKINGQANVYRISNIDSKVEKLTLDNFSKNPAPSPDGKYLAYTTKSESTGRIKLLDLSSKKITSSIDLIGEDRPSFSPNGKLLIYSYSEGGDVFIVSSKLDGDNKIKLIHPLGNPSSPSWGPMYLVGQQNLKNNLFDVSNIYGKLLKTNFETQPENKESNQENLQKPEEAEQIKIAQQTHSQSNIETSNIASRDRRVALVIGNSNYRTHPLRNPTNDANDVSNALKSSGFQVIDLRDASLQQMRAGVRQFGDRLINNDVGLVYYSGHGVEVKGRNYFIPVNADIQREDEIADQGLDVNLVLEKMSTAGKGVNILIVDACRDDPFGRSFRSSSRGLANMDAPRGTIIAYATSPGKVASDGDGRNSPYTKNLVRAMQQPNKPIEQVFKEVRRAVQEETKNQQTPWENTSLSGDFYFRVQK